MSMPFSVGSLLTSPTRAARRLLGGVVVHRTPDGTTSGMIVETEAYSENDPASHTFGGRTNRNHIMFGRAGHAYVYLSYGIHWCFNVVTGPAGRGEATLIRALEPLGGLAIMARRRGAMLPEIDEASLLSCAQTEPKLQRTLVSLCSGPARLTQAMGLGAGHYGIDLLIPRGALRLLPPAVPTPVARIVSSPRIGIRKAQEKRWRFFLADNLYVSRKSSAGHSSARFSRGRGDPRV